MRNEPNVVYKVVTAGYKSTFANSSAELVYSIGKTVIPKIPNSKIFVFDNYLAAVNMAAESVSNLRILICHQVGERYPFKLRAVYSISIYNFWEKQTINDWKGNDVTGGVFTTPACPSGTILVDGVIVLGEVPQ